MQLGGVRQREAHLEIFVKRYPTLYHVSHAENAAGIRRHGLLSTAALLEMFEIQGERRESLLGRRRSQAAELFHDRHGRAILRDQGPLNDERLAGVLIGGWIPSDWYRLLQTVWEIDTARLLARYESKALS